MPVPDLQPVFRGEKTFAEIAQTVNPADLPAMTAEVYDALKQTLADVRDQDMLFRPRDPNLKDDSEEGWTLGHVVVHLTAGLEENTCIGSVLARGVELDQRLRSETPWETVATAQQVHDRVAESRRIALAYLAAWPDRPNLELSRQPIPRFDPLNAISHVLLGLAHAEGHQAQLQEILRQSRGGVAAAA